MNSKHNAQTNRNIQYTYDVYGLKIIAVQIHCNIYIYIWWFIEDVLKTKCVIKAFEISRFHWFGDF